MRKISRYFVVSLMLLTAACAKNGIDENKEMSATGSGIQVVPEIDSQIRQERAMFFQGKAIVKFSEEMTLSVEKGLATKAVAAVSDEIGLSIVERVFPYAGEYEERTRREGLHRYYIVDFDKNLSYAKAKDVISQIEGVEHVEPCRKVRIKEFNDPMMRSLWEYSGKYSIHAKEAWEYTTGNPDVVVCVVDEGIQQDHPDLKWNLSSDNYNFVRRNTNITGGDHGTHVAGVIAAQNNNGVGISSIAGGDGSKPGVKIMSCQIFSGNYVASILAEVKAIKYAADNGAVILQCSWGYTSSAANQYDWAPQYGTDDEWMTDCPIEKDALLYFIHTAGSPNGPIEGGIGVFASGNESAAAAGYPGAYGEFVSVIGTAPDFTPAVYTNYGTGTDICAPGGDQDYFYDYEKDGHYGEIGCILSTVPYHISESGYAYMEGSSMATPHVSSALALAISYAAQQHRHLRADELKELLRQSATPVEPYLSGTKYYYKYVADLGQNQKKRIDLDGFKGKMSAGQLNVAGLLRAVKDAGRPMVFPNVYVAPGAQVKIDASRYCNASGNVSVSVDDQAVAQASVSGTMVTFVGKAEGITSATVTAGGQSSKIKVTVRRSSGNGWL